MHQQVVTEERGLGGEGEDPPLHTNLTCFRCSILRSGYKPWSLSSVGLRQEKGDYLLSEPDSTALPMWPQTLGLQRFEDRIIMKTKFLIAPEINSSSQTCGSGSQEIRPDHAGHHSWNVKAEGYSHSQAHDAGIQSTWGKSKQRKKISMFLNIHPTLRELTGNAKSKKQCPSHRTFP